MRIYMAGDLFSTAAIDFNAKLAGHLRNVGQEVFLPQEHEDHGEFDPHKIFRHDMRGLDWSNLVIANMDGADQDSGTCWELGYAYAKNKPIVLYRTDVRRGQEAINLMMTESANVIISRPLASSVEIAQEISDEIAARWQPYRHRDK